MSILICLSFEVTGKLHSYLSLTHDIIDKDNSNVNCVILTYVYLMMIIVFQITALSTQSILCEWTWKTNQIVTLGLFHFIGQSNGYTHTLPITVPLPPALTDWFAFLEQVLPTL